LVTSNVGFELEATLAHHLGGFDEIGTIRIDRFARAEIAGG